MNKIKEAQTLADKLLDECICQVGNNKGALKDEPESIKKSEEDIKKAVEMKEDSQITQMVNKIATYLGEGKEVKVSDVPKDKQAIFKINRGKAREKGGKLTKAEKGGKPVKPIKEDDQVKIAQQKDTLLDNNERITKDSDKLKPTITKEPTVESKLIMSIVKDIYKSRQPLDQEIQEGWFKDTAKAVSSVVRSARKKETPEWIKRRQQGSSSKKNHPMYRSIKKRKDALKGIFGDKNPKK